VGIYPSGKLSGMVISIILLAYPPTLSIEIKGVIGIKYWPSSWPEISAVETEKVFVWGNLDRLARYNVLAGRVVRNVERFT